MGAFASPNRAAVMNSLPAADRGAGGGMNATFQNSAQVLSIGIFFTLMISGLSGTLRSSLSKGLASHGVPAALALRAGNLPPVKVLFAAFLGYNPIQSLVGPKVLGTLSPANQAVLTGRSYFPDLISSPFRSGLREAFLFGAIACLVAAAASWSRGGRPAALAPTRELRLAGRRDRCPSRSRGAGPDRRARHERSAGCGRATAVTTSWTGRTTASVRGRGPS